MEDWISNLPDAVLTHILSFMPTKSAVRTRILSKRWENLWTRIPVLDFSECQGSQLLKRDKKLFQAFASKFLRHNRVASLRYFRFDFFQGMDENFIDQMISAIMWRSIDEMELCSHMSLNFSAASFRKLFSRISPGLVVLKLKGGFVIQVPDPVNFPSLETLHLDHLIFDDADGQPSSAGNLISGCPVLRELSIDDCIGVIKLEIGHSSLKQLEVSLLNIRDAVISAPNLEHLYLKRFNGKMLNGMYAHVNSKDRREFIVRKLLKSLDSEGLPLPTTQSLQANVPRYISTFLRLTTFKKVVNDHRSMFGNLTTLKLDSSLWTDIIDTLGYTPHLKSLTAFISDPVAEQPYYTPDAHQGHTPMPGCLSNCLETVDIHFSGGGHHMMNVTERLLRQGLALKEMKIHMGRFVPEKDTIMLERLSKLPKGSRAVKVMLYLPWPWTASQSIIKFRLTDQGLQLSFDELKTFSW